MAEPKIGVIHYNFPGFDWLQFLDYCAETGFGYIEVAISDVWGEGVEDPEAKAAECRKQMDERGIKAGALSAGNDFVLLDEAAIEPQIERMKRICCELAPILGTDTIRTEGGRPKDEVPLERYVEAMGGCLKRCVPFIEPAGIKLAVDNHGPVTNDGDLQVEIFEVVGSPNVGANLDTMNYRWFGHDLAKIDHFYEIVAPYTVHTHMKDGTGCRENYKGAALGDGEIHLHHTIKCLRDAGYDGVWCAEYEGPEAEGGVGYAKCCQWLKANL
jgi:sugar phosphate isomerase/epimerase